MEGLLFIMAFVFFAVLAIMGSRKNTKHQNNDNFETNNFLTNDVNPANGMPMIDDVIDVCGHVYGTND